MEALGRGMFLVGGREARAGARTHLEHSLEPIEASRPYMSHLPASDPPERNIPRPRASGEIVENRSVFSIRTAPSA